MLHGPSVRLSLRRLLRSRKFLFAALVSLIPAVAGTLMLVETASDPPLPDSDYPGYSALDAGMLVLAGTVPLVALLLAGGMLADDVEDRTLSYLLVRPVHRATQYRSRLAAVVLVTAGLALVQALLLGGLLLAEWSLWYQDLPYVVQVEYLARGEYILHTTASGPVVARFFAALVVGAPLAAAGLAALFGFVSLVTPRFHFIANLLVYLSWELPFGAVMASEVPGILTVSYAARSLLDRSLPGDEAGLHPVLAVGMLLLWVVLWATVGAQTMRNRDFTVTSAHS